MARTMAGHPSQDKNGVTLLRRHDCRRQFAFLLLARDERTNGIAVDQEQSAGFEQVGFHAGETEFDPQREISPGKSDTPEFFSLKKLSQLSALGGKLLHLVEQPRACVGPVALGRAI